MAKIEKILEKALNSPGSLRFSELCKLAEHFGFERKRKSKKRGSHNHIYWREGYEPLLNFQSIGRMSKEYQVKQLLIALRELGLIEEQEE